MLIACRLIYYITRKSEYKRGSCCSVGHHFSVSMLFVHGGVESIITYDLVKSTAQHRHIFEICESVFLLYLPHDSHHDFYGRLQCWWSQVLSYYNTFISDEVGTFNKTKTKQPLR